MEDTRSQRKSGMRARVRRVETTTAICATGAFPHPPSGRNNDTITQNHESRHKGNHDGATQAHTPSYSCSRRRASCSSLRAREYSSPASMVSRMARSSHDDLHVVSSTGRSNEKTGMRHEPRNGSDVGSRHTETKQEERTEHGPCSQTCVLASMQASYS